MPILRKMGCVCHHLTWTLPKTGRAFHTWLISQLTDKTCHTWIGLHRLNVPGFMPYALQEFTVGILVPCGYWSSTVGIISVTYEENHMTCAEDQNATPDICQDDGKTVTGLFSADTTIPFVSGREVKRGAFGQTYQDKSILLAYTQANSGHTVAGLPYLPDCRIAGLPYCWIAEIFVGLTCST